MVESGKSESEEEARPVKKRKRKATVSGKLSVLVMWMNAFNFLLNKSGVLCLFLPDTVEGFNVFKPSKSPAPGIQQNDHEKNELSQTKKELNRQIEVVFLLIVTGSGHICFYFT